jgi:hypothetical protein
MADLAQHVWLSYEDHLNLDDTLMQAAREHADGWA